MAILDLCKISIMEMYLGSNPSGTETIAPSIAYSVSLHISHGAKNPRLIAMLGPPRLLKVVMKLHVLLLVKKLLFSIYLIEFTKSRL